MYQALFLFKYLILSVNFPESKNVVLGIFSTGLYPLSHPKPPTPFCMASSNDSTVEHSVVKAEVFSKK